MADLVSARIQIGGALAAPAFPQLCTHIAAYELCINWGGDRFDASAPLTGRPLDLYAYDVRNGSFDALEDFCRDKGLAFWRWSGGSPGAFDPEIVVFTGRGAPESFTASESEYAVYDGQAIEALGSYEAILDNVARSRFDPPAFKLTDADPCVS